MCGVCGFTWEDQGLIREMGRRIAHRGPDDSGDYVARAACRGTGGSPSLICRKTAANPWPTRTATSF